MPEVRLLWDDFRLLVGREFDGPLAFAHHRSVSASGPSTANERSSHLGMAGHLVAMSEFLLRGYNTALPVVDRGDDLLTIEDDEGDVRRVQVKTRAIEPCRPAPCAGCKICRDSLWIASAKVSRKQLQEDKNTPLHYLFALRSPATWCCILISQLDLVELFDKACGSNPRMKGHDVAASDDLQVSIAVKPGEFASFWGQRLESYPDVWRAFPPTRFATSVTRSDR